MKYPLPFCLLFCFCFLQLSGQVTVTLTNVPDYYTPLFNELYIAGNFNNWNPGDVNHQFVKNSNGTYSTQLSSTNGTAIEYKITRGNWATVETYANGISRPNRTYTYNDGDQITINVENWEDTSIPHTVAGNIRILDMEFPIPQLNKTRKIWIYLPQDYYTSSDNYPVVYMQDGQNLFDESYTGFGTEWQIDETMERLQNDGFPAAIIIGIDHGNADRIDEYSPWVNPSYGGGDGAAYVDFMTNTLKPFVDANFRTLTDRDNTAILGSSMGGLISLYGAVNNQNVFSKVGVFSPSLWFSDNVYDNAFNTGKQEDMRFYFLAGDQESSTMVSNMQAMYDTLGAGGFATTEMAFETRADGQHAEWFWAREFYNAYVWLFDAQPIPPTNPPSVAPDVKKVILQAFWWDYWNTNYPNGWANYLTELAPRLKELGIDAVWIPPSVKNNHPSSVGYSPFDNYDLGDKYQKGHTETRLGNKDELLRMIAVMHSNGIEVIQDIVLNHVDNAGSATGAGGVDNGSAHSLATAAGFKNFRYASYATPATDETECDYASRSGRWSKNADNFHPHPGHNVSNDDWTGTFWGPDFCYGYTEAGLGNGFGQSSNICSFSGCSTTCHDPTQNTGNNRNEARDWMMWYKKQTGVDGFRWDAVKHFPYFVQQDISYNLKYNLPPWAAGGEEMLNFGEYVDIQFYTDQHVNDVAYANFGTEKLMGTIDFNLRSFGASGGIYGMVTGFGGYNMAKLPSEQCNERFETYIDGRKVHRTVNYVNMHDTFRPILDASGNYIGWDTAAELAPHIEPNQERMSAAYAVTTAMDGNTLVYFEDLFDIGYNGNRYNHDPSNSSQLPERSDLVNLIWCHQNLGFKDGDYEVASSGDDHLMIRRNGKAIIGITDSYSNWQSEYVYTGFAPGTYLYDYSGAHGSGIVIVDGNGWAAISIPPVDPSLNVAGRKGYSVWAPSGQLNSSFLPPRSNITYQEWELADDLGDSHCQSLGQGGALPANSCNKRIAGKIFAKAGAEITFQLFQPGNYDLTIGVYDLEQNKLEEISGIGNFSGTYEPLVDGWITFKVHNTVATNPSQELLFNVSYIAPESVYTSAYPSGAKVAYWSGNGLNTSWFDCRNWEEGLIPDPMINAIIPSCASHFPVVIGVADCKNLTILPGGSVTIASGATLNAHGN